MTESNASIATPPLLIVKKELNFSKSKAFDLETVEAKTSDKMNDKIVIETIDDENEVKIDNKKSTNESVVETVDNENEAKTSNKKDEERLKAVEDAVTKATRKQHANKSMINDDVDDVDDVGDVNETITKLAPAARLLPSTKPRKKKPLDIKRHLFKRSNNSTRKSNQKMSLKELLKKSTPSSSDLNQESSQKQAPSQQEQE